MRAAYYVRKAWKRYDGAQKLMAELIASGAPVTQQLQAFVKFGVGFFFFGISMVPPQMEFVTKLLGFRSNRPLAAELLSHVMSVPESGKSVEASLIL